MPKMTGLELVGEVAHLRPDLPIVLTTGVKQPFEPEMAQSLGIRELLLKPFDFRSLAEVIAKACGPRNLPDNFDLGISS